jgi:hypothetical protein
MAQRAHRLTAPLAHGVALVLPPVGRDEAVAKATLEWSSSSSTTSSDERHNSDSDKEETIPYESLPQFWVPPTKPATATASLLCILPSFLRRRRKKQRAMADTSTVHLLDEASQGEWS